MFVIAVGSVERECVALLHGGLPDVGMPSLLSGDCGVVVFCWLWVIIGGVNDSRAVSGFC